MLIEAEGVSPASSKPVRVGFVQGEPVFYLKWRGCEFVVKNIRVIKKVRE